MPDERPTADVAPPPPKRPWWRLHFSTWCLVLLTVAVLAVLNVPGRLPETFIGPNRSGITHGWPWTMMQRNVPPPTTDQNLSAFLWSWSIEPPSDMFFGIVCMDPLSDAVTINRVYYPAALAGNAAVAGAILAAVIFLAERRRRRRRSFWQITLAEGLVACAILASGLAWLGWEVKNTERQRAAVAAIDAENGTPSVDVSWKSRLPDWWEELQGPPYPRTPILGDIEYVSTTAGSADAVLKRLKNLPAVRNLYLDGRPLNDRSLLADLQHLRNLRLLGLSGTGVRDEDLKHVAACETLVDLDLSHNPISDEGLKHLHGLRNLRFLNLTNVDVSVEAVDALQAALPELSITDD